MGRGGEHRSEEHHKQSLPDCDAARRSTWNTKMLGSRGAAQESAAQTDDSPQTPRRGPRSHHVHLDAHDAISRCSPLPRQTTTRPGGRQENVDDDDDRDEDSQDNKWKRLERHSRRCYQTVICGFVSSDVGVVMQATTICRHMTGRHSESGRATPALASWPADGRFDVHNTGAPHQTSSRGPEAPRSPTTKNLEWLAKAFRFVLGLGDGHSMPCCFAL